MLRTIDANINRICEGLRIIEDYIRFESKSEKLNSSNLKKLKEIRHFIRENISSKYNIELLSTRDSIDDPGKHYSEIESNRNSAYDLLKANFLRIQEGLRVLEEFFKLNDLLNEFIPKVKDFRFKIYSIEKEVLLHMYINDLNLNYYLSIDITDLDDEEIKNLFSYAISNEISMIEIKSKSLNNKIFYDKALYIYNLSKGKKINLVIKNRIEISLLLNSFLLIIDKNNLPVEIIKKLYNKKIGLFLDNIKELNSFDINSFDFVIIDSIINDISKIEKKNSNDIKFGFLCDINIDLPNIDLSSIKKYSDIY